MLRVIPITALMTLLLAAAAYAAPLPRGEVYGFSSDDFGGSSYLGVDTQDITPERLGTLHLKEESGVEITMVDQDAPAGKAGLKEQDVILTLNGEKIASVEQLRRMIRETPPGRVITLGVSRNGQPMTFKVQLGDRKNSFAHDFGPKSKDFHFEMPTMPVMPEFDMPVSVVVVHSSVRSGLMIENLTPQLGDFFGAKNGEGVLVRSVERGSRAEKAGFRAGDVIVKVNGETVHDAGDFSHALRARKDSNTASVNVLRDKKEQTLTLQLPDRKQSELNSEIDFPDLKAESLEMGELTSEWAHLGPEMEEAINRDLSDLKPQIEQYQKEWQLHEKDLQKQMREMQREWQKHGVEIQKKLRLEHHADI